jgi:hypothetical protein
LGTGMVLPFAWEGGRKNRAPLSHATLPSTAWAECFTLPAAPPPQAACSRTPARAESGYKFGEGQDGYCQA